MNRSVALSFYQCSSKSTLRGSELSTSGWQRCKVYDGRHWTKDLGVAGSMFFIKLSDGRIIATNDLWHDTSGDYGWSRSVPNGALVGVSLGTRMCRPKSTKALNLIMDMMVDHHTFCHLKSGLSDREAYEQNDNIGSGEIPEVTERTYRSSHVYSRFSSPEGAILTHVKVGDDPPQPLDSKEQLEGLDPFNTPVYILYEEQGSICALKKGDVIDECYVYDKPGW